MKALLLASLAMAMACASPPRPPSRDSIYLRGCAAKCESEGMTDPQVLEGKDEVHCFCKKAPERA